MNLRLDAEIERAYYAFDRYETIATFALIYHEKDLSIEKLGELVRSTDRFINIDKNHYFMIFHYTAHEEAYKASQNLLFKLDNYFQDTKSCIAIDNFNKLNAPAVVLSRLNQIINETKKNSLTRIEDESILDLEI